MRFGTRSSLSRATAIERTYPPRVEERSLLTEAQARAFLELDGSAELPDEETLLADAEQIVEVHAAVARETAALGAQGLQLSPIWEVRAALTPPEVRARLAVRAPSIRARTLSVEAFDALDDAFIDALIVALRWLVDDPIGAAHALENTHKLWFDREAPSRVVDVPARPHLRVLTMSLADLARKHSAGFTPLEWLASLGLPLAEIREEVGAETDRDDASIQRSMRDRTVAMWAEELRWQKKAFGR